MHLFASTTGEKVLQSKMRELACLVFITLVYAIHGAPSPHIIGGEDALIINFPYHASLRVNGTHKCSGSILNNLNVLTTAQCVKGLENSLDDLKVHVGTNLLNESGYVFDVANIHVHINYDDYLLVNDIALVYLKSPISYNKLVQPINLSNKEDFENQVGTLSGWGTKLDGQNTSNILQQVVLKVFPQTDCMKMNWKVSNSHICTSTQEKTGACRGDAGGPLVLDGTLIGIFSFGQDRLDSHCASGYPDVYTRISSFKIWITVNLKDFECK